MTYDPSMMGKVLLDTMLDSNASSVAVEANRAFILPASCVRMARTS